MSGLGRFIGRISSTVFAVLFVGLAEPALADVVFVSASATGNNDGTSWENAFTDLWAALNSVEPGDQVWVASATYRPDVPNGSRSRAFRLSTGVAIYGGFDGTETELEQRDWRINVTVLSGDLNGDDGPDFSNNGENSYHVVKAEHVDATAVLDGFTITAGNANGPNLKQDVGGGLRVLDANPTLANCTLTANDAITGGGVYAEASGTLNVQDSVMTSNRSVNEGSALHVAGGTVAAERCTFSDNSGAGQFNDSGATLLLTDCEIRDEGGFRNTCGTAVLTRCLFQECTDAAVGNCGELTVIDSTFESNAGAAIDNHSDLLVQGCAFLNNDTGIITDHQFGEAKVWTSDFIGQNGYALINDQADTLTAINCRIIQNGGGVFNNTSFGAVATNLVNCVISGNGTAATIVEESEMSFTNCTVYANEMGIQDWGNFSLEPCQGTLLWANGPGDSFCACGISALGEDPLFVDPLGPDGVAGTLDDDLRLLAGSPAIDAGGCGTLPADEIDMDGDGDTSEPVPLDINGASRYYDDPETPGAGADVGAHEYFADCNGNGNSDLEDIVKGTSQDCDSNLVPDECDVDCNANEIPDACDIQEGTSMDCAGEGIPDECEPDCNANGVADSCDVAEGISEDCNANGVPDPCDIDQGTSEDVDGNGEIDVCECPPFSTITADDADEDDWFGRSLDFRNGMAVIGANSEDRVYVYQLAGVEWQHLQTLDAESDHSFGEAVAIGDQTLLAGAAIQGDDQVVHAYRLIDGTWAKEQVITSPEPEEAELFGSTIALDGNTAVIGDYWYGTDAPEANIGAAYVYTYDGSAWTLTDILLGDDVSEHDWFGHSIALSGDVAAIAAPWEDSVAFDSGAVYVYRFNGAEWPQEAKLKVSDAAQGDLLAFGDALAIDGDVIVAGTDSKNEGRGAAYVFRFDGGEWIEEAKLTASDSTPGHNFGVSTAIHENTIVVAAEGGSDEDESAGGVYVFAYDGRTWTEVAKRVVIGPEEKTFEGVRTPMNLYHDLLLVGEPEANEALELGAVYAFLGVGPDCNGTPFSDICDIARDTSLDSNGNLVPDECEGGSPLCEGDANGDGTVDPLDSGFVQARFGCMVGAGDVECDQADVNSDLLVDPLDVGFVLARLGSCL